MAIGDVFLTKSGNNTKGIVLVFSLYEYKAVTSKTIKKTDGITMNDK
jgi:hypothetical protein